MGYIVCLYVCVCVCLYDVCILYSGLSQALAINAQVMVKYNILASYIWTGMGGGLLSLYRLYAMTLSKALPLPLPSLDGIHHPI